MFKWYFSEEFIENDLLFWISTITIIVIILVTIALVRKELKGNNYVDK